MSQLTAGRQRGVGMKMLRELGADCTSLTLRAVLLLMVGACLLMSGCKAAPTWSTESRSPDEKMVATAEAFTNDGFVAPGPPTTLVYLKQTAGSEKAMLVFAFSEGPPDGMQVNVNWLTPTHLELTYGGQHTIDFQAVEYAGVDISIRNATVRSPVSK
jgi:hypothetical protein